MFVFRCATCARLRKKIYKSLGKYFIALINLDWKKKRKGKLSDEKRRERKIKL
jgi:hypothetical protein